MDVSRIDSAELAELLEQRKKNNQRIALILGSRTGALSRSPSFVEETMRYSSTSTQSFNNMRETEQFSMCYSQLEMAKEDTNKEDFAVFLKQQIKKTNFSIADEFMAGLVEQRIFRVILSFNPDDILYDAFTTIGLKENEHFVNFDLRQLLSIKDTNLASTIISKFVTHEKTNACKVIKLYNDVETFVYSLNREELQEELGVLVKKLLDRMMIKEALIVGMDTMWDRILLAALPPRIETIWFANEDEQVKETFLSTYEKVKQLRFMIGVQGVYEKVLTALHSQINPGKLPHRYELTSQLQKLSVMQRDLTIIKDRIEELNDGVTIMQNQITKLSEQAKKIIDLYNTGEEK